MKTQKPKNVQELLKYQNEFSETKLWDKLGEYAGKLGKELVYQVLVLYYVMKSPDISLKTKAIIIGALGYLILPIDLIPDIMPVVGFTDDAATIAMALEAVATSVTPAIEKQARRKMNDWF